MAVNKKNIMTRYFFVILLMGLVGIAIIAKGTMIMFTEQQYWHDVADRFVKENVTVKPNRGNILSSDGKLMASSLPEYKIFMDFMSGEKDEKRRRQDQHRKDSIWKANLDSICIGLHQIFPDISSATFKSHLRKGREMKSRNYNILPNRNKRISYIQYKEAKRLPVFKMSKYEEDSTSRYTTSARNLSALWPPKRWDACMPTRQWGRATASNWLSTPCLKDATASPTARK